MARPHTRAYRRGELVAAGFDVADVSDHLCDPDVVVWVDYCAPTREDLSAIGEELGLHELALEDALSPHQRPKLDHYASHRFLSCHAVRVDGSSGVLGVTEVDAFFHPRWLVTVRKDDRFGVEAVMARLDRSSDLVAHGAAALVYGLLDVVVDGYFVAVAAFDDYYDTIAEGIFAEEPLDPARQREWFRMRRSLVRFHRLVVPLREAVSSLLRREHDAVPEALYPWFQDVYDHTLRVSESTDSLRELIGTIVDTNLSLRDYRQNQVMKRVTSWAAIIAVPTLVTGWYGMNVPYPGDGEAWGVATAAGLVVAASAFLYWLFRRRDWL